MPAFKFYNIGQANGEISAAEIELAPALEKAGIKTISINGKVVPVAEAPLAARIAALLAANPPGTSSQQISDVLVSNDQISKALEKANTDLAIAQTSVGTLTRENADLKAQLNTAQTSVQTLTGEKADSNLRLTAATNQFSANGKELKDHDTELCRVCIAAGCLDLKDADGKPLAADAKEEDKMAAAGKIPFSDKLKAYRGAVNAAIAKTGANPLEIPTAPPAGVGAKAEPKGRNRMLATMKIDGQPNRN